MAVGHVGVYHGYQWSSSGRVRIQRRGKAKGTGAGVVYAAAEWTSVTQGLPHPKNFAYLMSPEGRWRLAPAYDVTFCEGPGGYHQMDVMGEALAITRAAMLRLAREAEIPETIAASIIDSIRDVAGRFKGIANELFPQAITRDTLDMIQRRIDQNVALLG